MAKHKSNDKLDYMKTNNCSSKEIFKRQNSNKFKIFSTQIPIQDNYYKLYIEF